MSHFGRWSLIPFPTERYILIPLLLPEFICDRPPAIDKLQQHSRDLPGMAFAKVYNTVSARRSSA
jgi:hypothetical protein